MSKNCTSAWFFYKSIRTNKQVKDVILNCQIVLILVNLNLKILKLFAVITKLVKTSFIDCSRSMCWKLDWISSHFLSLLITENHNLFWIIYIGWGIVYQTHWQTYFNHYGGKTYGMSLSWGTRRLSDILPVVDYWRKTVWLGEHRHCFWTGRQ